MTTQAKLIRLPFLSFAVGAAPGAAGTLAEWTHAFAPVGDRPALGGQEVELHAALDGGAAALSEATPIWFDIIDEAFLLSGADQDRVARLAGAGAAPPAAAFPSQEQRQPAFRRLEAEQPWSDGAASFKAEHPEDYAGRLLIVEEQIGGARRFHAVTWWSARAPAGRLAPRLIFRANLGPEVQAQTATALAVSQTPAGEGGLQLALQYEDGEPMAGAAIEVALGGRTLTAVCDAEGVARIDAPVGPDERFRVFLRSFAETYAEVPGEPPPPPPSAPLEPEVVTVFAFDSSFPVPAVYAALARVRDAARARPEVRVRLYGHTDPHGSVEYNQSLSERRARAVLALLTDDLAAFDEIAASEAWDLRHYQTMLRGLGCNPGAIDGDEGAMTREATRRFQAEYNLFSFHRGLARRRGALSVNGSLNSATRAALRDAYVAWAPHLPAGRLAEPPLVGCSENQPVSDVDWENRRVTVVYRSEAELAAESGDLCAGYRSVVPQEQERPRGPRFVDFAWLREESGAVHLSALAALPDGSPAQFTVHPAAQPLPEPPPDSSSGQPRPEVEGPAVPVSGQVSGGVAFARWGPGAEAAGRIFDYTTWLVDHDFQLEIESEADEAAPDSPADAAQLWAAPGIRPPVFAVDSGEHWGFSRPPGQLLEAVQLVDELEPAGLALRSDGTLVAIAGRDGWLGRAAAVAAEGPAEGPDELAELEEEAPDDELGAAGAGDGAAGAAGAGDGAAGDGAAGDDVAEVAEAPVFGWAEAARSPSILALALAGQGLGQAAVFLAQVGPAPTAPPAYGGYDLQRGDRDSDHNYGGALRTAEGGEALPAPGATGFVRQLQEDLRTLGFHIVGTPDGGFGRLTQWAVREFQIYAKMEHLAEESATATRYVDRLTQVANTDRYAGPVSGVANARTRALIQTWLANRWRCPLVIEVWELPRREGDAPFRENVWLHDEVPPPAKPKSGPKPKLRRFFARDFSGYYTFPATRSADDLVVVGDCVRFGSRVGPRSIPPNHTWVADPPTHPTADGEILPESLVGKELARLNDSERSTFKVIRAVAERECAGFFDSLTAYDNAFVSLGPCHWTLGLVDKEGSVSGGELCGYLAYLREFDRAAFDRAIEFFGASVTKDWLTPARGTTEARRDGDALFIDALRTYNAGMALQKEDGTFAGLALGKTENEWNYFKTWHWFYRFQMAGRTIEGFRKRMWHMARIRLRDLRSVELPAATVPGVPDGPGATRPATIRDVFTSEMATALVLRWHIFRPAHITGDHLRAAIKRAALAGDPSTWTDDDERKLIDGLIAQSALAHSALPKGLQEVRDWPDWAARGAANPRRYALDPAIGGLATERGTFHFDEADLPPAPPTP